ncbi:MAG: hypothetical protein ACWA5P_14595 [bacterium]
MFFIILILFKLSSIIYSWTYKRFAKLEVWEGTKTFFSHDKHFKVEHFGQPPLYSYITKYIGINYIGVGSFLRVSNAKTGEILGYIDHEEFFNYEFINNQFCIGSKIYYREGWFGNVLIEDNERCIDLR